MAFCQVAAAIDTEPAASPNCDSIAEWLDGMAVEPTGGRPRRDLEGGILRCAAELRDPAGRMEGAAHVEALRHVHSGRLQVLAHPGPHVALPVLVAVVARPRGRPEPSEQAADQHHHLAVR